MKGKVPSAKFIVEEKSSSIAWGKRLLTAALAIPALIGMVCLDTSLFAIFVLSMLGIGYKEFSTLIAYEMRTVYILIPLVFYSNMNWVFVFAVTILISLVPLVDQGPSVGMRAGILNVFFLNVFAIPIMYAPRIHGELERGRMLALLWILVSFASDAGALIVGSRWGKHLLCPSISPKKTWEGVLGGFIGGIGSAVFFYCVGFDNSSRMVLADFVVIGFIEASCGAVGDLVESGFKRFVAAKDASNLLPGHGGMLDRLDALAATAPFVYSYCIVTPMRVGTMICLVFFYFGRSAYATTAGDAEADPGSAKEESSNISEIANIQSILTREMATIQAVTQVSRELSLAGISAAHAAALVQLLNSYLDLVQLALVHLQAIAIQESNSKTNLGQVLEAATSVVAVK